MDELRPYIIDRGKIFFAAVFTASGYSYYDIVAIRAGGCACSRVADIPFATVNRITSFHGSFTNLVISFSCLNTSYKFIRAGSISLEMCMTYNEFVHLELPVLHICRIIWNVLAHVKLILMQNTRVR